MEDVYVGIDIGTSGIRAIAITKHRECVAQSRIAFTKVQTSPSRWLSTLEQVLIQLNTHLHACWIRAISIDGTSATVVALNEQGEPLADALLYNDTRATNQAALITNQAPDNSAALGASSALAKALWLSESIPERITRFQSQASWCAGVLSDNFGVIDPNNALKFGYDATNRCWPEWITTTGLSRSQLPEVVAPTHILGTITPDYVKQLGIDPRCQIVNGTTDSTAAFIASGASEPGDAVTSIGSTLVLKIISDKPVFNSQYGVYSQPFKDQWLVGGASNSGGNVLRHFFKDEQIESLSRQMDITKPTGLNYYPLIKKGERFPVADANFEAKVSPRPDSDTQFLQGLFEGLAMIEQQGYQLLQQLGAPEITSLRSNGGGANNPWFNQIRQQYLEVKMIKADHDQAAFGSALNALAAIEFTQRSQTA